MNDASRRAAAKGAKVVEQTMRDAGMRRPFDKARDVTLECPKCRAYKTIDRGNQGLPDEVVLVAIICPDCDDGDRHAERWFSSPGVEVSQDDRIP